MSQFCLLVNNATEQGCPKISEEAFLHSMGSIMYRLLHARFEPGSLDEAVRLALLAFSSPIFLHWNRVELPDRQFTSAYREALAGLDYFMDTEHTIVPQEHTIIPQKHTIIYQEYTVTPQQHLWLLMVGALSMAHEPDNLAWLRPRLRMAIDMCSVSSWDDMRDVLRSFLWVGLVYDGPGKDVYDSVLSQ
jgi:hypothetical protein